MEREATLSELDLRAQLLAEKAGRAGHVQNRLHAKTKKLAFVNKDREVKESVLNEKSHYKGTLKKKLKAAQAAIDRGERVIHDSAEFVCNGYTILTRA